MELSGSTSSEDPFDLFSDDYGSTIESETVDWEYDYSGAAGIDSPMKPSYDFSYYHDDYSSQGLEDFSWE